ncbi:Ribosomal RNA small subunit methyltransferase B [BD1-7 clade bacterium]|uniref:16S rRNA (cytosine(967)-C(5))-methyltransferase n=1 Tax=BD1-7 clade bacterium TaxID=2029982 RepID=A0A5S9MW62_9GAMM|nr:Ribosomal RNA small subunit methyltransferase B [BD1-7 clade bacterium]CAA0083323.1 Ribosomal RNA small subunit methyltransferase B [BD1-7 clade bacterium]
MGKTPTDPRAAAAMALQQVFTHRHSLNTAIPTYGARLSTTDAALFKAICYGVCRYYRSLEDIVQPLLKKPFKDKDVDILCLLYVGIWQLGAMRVPGYAAIDSCVEATRILKKPWASGLVNAVLRAGQSVLESNEDWLHAKDHAEHPDWFTAKLRHNWPDRFTEVLEQNNQEPPLCLRVNTHKLDRDTFIAQLAEQGTQAYAGALSESAVYVEDRQLALTELAAFQQGLISVQDEAAQLAAQLLAPESGHHVLDACAAPGGKTCHLLQMQPDITMTAVDSDAKRIERIQENLDRLAISAELVASDITDLDNWWTGKPFDRILCDVPCSATGVIRRHPDIKLLRTGDDIKQLAELQLQIVKTLWQCLKPGGIMLYATCSVLSQENSRIIERFCQQTPDCREIPIDAKLGEGHIASPCGAQLLPQAGAHDGFYYARLYKQDVEPI